MDCSEPTSKLCVRTNARIYEWNLPCRSIVPMAAMAPGNAPRPRIRRQDKPLTFIMVLVLVTPSPQVAKKGSCHGSITAGFQVFSSCPEALHHAIYSH